MEWLKAGRRPTKEKKDDWTREELKIAASQKEGLRMLAGAVLSQWIKDGKPDDIPQEWVAVLKELL